MGMAERLFGAFLRLLGLVETHIRRLKGKREQIFLCQEFDIIDRNNIFLTLVQIIISSYAQ